MLRVKAVVPFAATAIVFAPAASFTGKLKLPSAARLTDWPFTVRMVVPAVADPATLSTWFAVTAWLERVERVTVGAT